jgi:hypothetical protein
MAKARSHQSARRSREVRVAKAGTARDAIGPLRKGHEAFVLTFGTFSLIDALVYLLDETGPADVTISTWVAAKADLSTCHRLLEMAKVRTMRFVVDSNFQGRQARFMGHMRELFGDDCIRTTRNHAKFLTIRNDEWSLAVRTSMNLNTNPRLENIEISDDPALCGFLEGVVAEIFDEREEGDLRGAIPSLPGFEPVQPAGKVRMGSVEVVKIPSVGTP